MPRKVLLDACIPHWLRQRLSSFTVETAQYAGLDMLTDTRLIDAIEGRFDVLVTLDRNLAYQQRIEGRAVAVVVVRPQSQTPEAFEALLPWLDRAIANVRPGRTEVVSMDES